MRKFPFSAHITKKTLHLSARLYVCFYYITVLDTRPVMTTQNSTSITVYGKPDGTAPLTLTDKIGGGGQGAIYAKMLDSGIEAACKIFNDRQPSDLVDKIHRMVEIGRENAGELIKHRHVAWPQLVIYDKQGNFIGYAMKRVKGLSLNFLAHTQAGPKHFPDMDRDKVAKLLIGIWKTVNVLHKRGIFIGDVNLNNFLCTPDYQPCLIDTDSYQVEKWKCPVGRAEMTPPEHLDKRFGEVTRTRESDLYSLAILSFQCLMLGKHPFEYIGSGSGLENQRRGVMPYLTGHGAQPGEYGGVPRGSWWNYWSNYPHKVMGLFARALAEGGGAPAVRPAPEQWVEVLRKYRYMLTKPHAKLPNGELFQHTSDIRPDEPKPENLAPLSKEEAKQVETRPLRYNAAPLEALLAPDEAWDLIDNPTPRIIVSLVVDASSNMAGQRMDAVNAGLRRFLDKIAKDDFAQFSTEPEIFACGGSVSHFSARQGGNWHDLSAGGEVCISTGMVKALNATKARMNELEKGGVSTYRPWIVLLTASNPDDNCDWAQRTLQSVKVNRPMEIFAVGMGAGYSAEELAKLSPERLPQKVEEQKVGDFFDWLALSMSTVSMSVPSYEWRLPPTDTWATNSTS